MSVLFTQLIVPMTEYKIDVFVGGTLEERRIIQKNRYGLSDDNVNVYSLDECCTIDSGQDSIVGCTTRFVVGLKTLDDIPVLIHELFNLMFHISKEIGDFELSKAGASLTVVILNVTDAALEVTVPSLVVNEIVPALVPLRFAVGVYVAASKAVLIAESVPAAVKLAEPFPLPPKVIPVVPVDKVPPVIVNVTVCASPSISET